MTASTAPEAGRVERLRLHRLRIPLARPYKLAFGPVTHYDTIVAEVTLDDGRDGFGEATLLTGYTDETIDGSWALVTDIGAALAGAAVDRYVSTCSTLALSAPFVASALMSALQCAQRHAVLAMRGRVPVLGLLQGEDEAELRGEFDRLYAEGYRTVKFKVGFDADADARHLAAAQRAVAGRALIRVDANQGYDAEEAVRFIAAVEPVGIELFEQPCAADDWHAHAVAAKAAARTGLPLMLDESIYGLADIERAAAEHACAYLKVKLMKFPGLAALADAIARIRALGMSPVLGNGVACDVSCWMEACVAARDVSSAGEMNGFLKVPRMLFSEPLAFADGHIVLPERVPTLDRRALASYATDFTDNRVTRIACNVTPSSPA